MDHGTMEPLLLPDGGQTRKLGQTGDALEPVPQPGLIIIHGRRTAYHVYNTALLCFAGSVSGREVSEAH